MTRPKRKASNMKCDDKRREGADVTAQADVQPTVQETNAEYGNIQTICWTVKGCKVRSSVQELMCLCLVVTKAAFNTRTQTLNKDNTTKSNSTIQRVCFCSAFQAPAWSTSANVPAAIVWMYLLSF